MRKFKAISKIVKAQQFKPTKGKTQRWPKGVKITPIDSFCPTTDSYRGTNYQIECLQEKNDGEKYWKRLGYINPGEWLVNDGSYLVMTDQEFKNRFERA